MSLLSFDSHCTIHDTCMLRILLAQWNLCLVIGLYLNVPLVPNGPHVISCDC